MGRLEMLVEKRNAILDEIARLNREITNKEEELEDVKYRISIQRILRERENILEEEINATGRQKEDKDGKVRDIAGKKR